MELNDLKDSLTALKYGEIATVAMIDRGAYAEIEESIEAESKDQKINSSRFIGQMTKEKHIIFVECLYLGTTEIKGFLNSLKENNLLENSKLVLLDLPQLEYMMLRDSLAGQFKL